MTLYPGQTVQLSATTRNTAGDPLTDRSITWSSGGAAATVSTSGLVTAVSVGSAIITASSEGRTGSAMVTVALVPVATLTLSTSDSSPVVRTTVQLVAETRDSANGILLGRSVLWSSLDTLTARVNSSGSLTTISAGTVRVTAASEGRADTLSITVEAAPLALKGLWTQFERRGWPNGYWPGQPLVSWDTHDAVVGSTIGAEIGAQMDAIKSLGVNMLTVEIRAVDPGSSAEQEAFPTCAVNPALGASWPQPTSLELEGLGKLMDAAQSRGLKMLLFLVAVHHDDATRTNASTWMGALMDVVKAHPALELIVFGGDDRTVDENGDGAPDACGRQAEPPLWLGPNSSNGRYVRWAIDFGRARGVPIRKLGASAIVGDAATMSEAPAGPNAEGGHLWDPVRTMKLIFDDLGVAPSDRTYALSWYTRAANGQDAATWAESTIRSVMRFVGSGTGARVVMSEMGSAYAGPSWSTAQAIAVLTSLSRKYGLEGGSLWRWTNYEDVESSDPNVQMAIKVRGVAYTYTAAQAALVAAYAIP